MKNVVRWAVVIGCAIAMPAGAQQTFSGRLSESICGASHQLKASAAALADRACIFACLNARATYVLVDEHDEVIPIANQDAMGLPLYAGRPVKITGERKGAAIFVTKVEAIPAHLHIGHVMTNWRDTPGTRGFLPVAVDEARVAALHARLAEKSASLDEIKLHAAHVMHALDPAVERSGPGAGYGVRKAAAGALQHLEFAARPRVRPRVSSRMPSPCLRRSRACCSGWMKPSRLRRASVPRRMPRKPPARPRI